jgi:hypothetical protein
LSYNWVKKFIFFFCCDFIFLSVCYSWRYYFKYLDILFNSHWQSTPVTETSTKMFWEFSALTYRCSFYWLTTRSEIGQSHQKKFSCQKSEKNYHCYVEWWCKKLNWCLNKHNINVKVRSNINVDVRCNFDVDIRSNIFVDVKGNIDIDVKK